MKPTEAECLAFILGAFLSLVPFIGTGYVAWAAWKWQENADSIISRIGTILVVGCLHSFFVAGAIFHLFAEK